MTYFLIEFIIPAKVIPIFCHLPNSIGVQSNGKFQRYGKLKKSNIRPMYYATRQAWTRIRKHIENTSKKE